MKFYISILFLGLFVLSSCSEESSFAQQSGRNDVPICMPYIGASAVAIEDFPAADNDENTEILNHRQEGNCLILSTKFSGGCTDHVLLLFIDELESVAINVSGALTARLFHDNTDPCEAEVLFDVDIDISNLDMDQSDTVQLAIENYNEIIELSF